MRENYSQNDDVTLAHLHELMQIVGESPAWVDKEFDLVEHNRLYGALWPHRKEPAVRKALNYTCMGHEVPDSVINEIKETHPWITTINSDSTSETSKSASAQRTRPSLWKTWKQRLSSFFAGPTK